MRKQVYAETRALYRKETMERWGNTQEYRIAQEKDANRSAAENDAVMDAASLIFSAFASLAADGTAPEADAAQTLVQRWHAHITEHHYPCTKQILAGLAQMYIHDERFQNNLDA